MTITLYAQPYDISATGFYFKSVEEFKNKAKNLTNDYGQPVEEFEIQFIDGDAIARDLSVEYTETTIAGGRYVYACR